MSDGQFVAVAGRRFHFIRKGAGKPLVLIHGAGGGDSRDWQFSLLDDFAKTNDVIAFDRPGIGKSAEIDNMTDPFAQAAVLKEATKRLGIEQPILVGHSFGALVALCWGLLGPEDVAGIVAISPVAMPSVEKPPALYKLFTTPVLGRVMARLACTVARPKMLDMSLQQSFGAMGPPADYMDKTGDTLFRTPGEQQNIVREILGAFSRLEEISKQYKGLTVPVEIIFGTEDRNTITKDHAQPLADALPNANLTLIEGVAHMPHYQAPQAVLDAVARLNATK